MCHRDRLKEPIKSSNPLVFPATIKPIVKEDELHDEGDRDLDTMMANLANDNDNMLYSGNADVHQENVTFHFQDENFIGFSNNNTDL